jgi:hypothetical protein
VVFAAMFVFSDEMLLKDTKELRLPLRLPEVDRAPPRLKEERHVACAFARVAAKEAMNDSPKKSDVYCIERKPKTSKNIHIQSYALLLI